METTFYFPSLSTDETQPSVKEVSFIRLSSETAVRNNIGIYCLVLVFTTGLLVDGLAFNFVNLYSQVCSAFIIYAVGNSNP